MQNANLMYLDQTVYDLDIILNYNTFITDVKLSFSLFSDIKFQNFKAVFTGLNEDEIYI